MKYYDVTFHELSGKTVVKRDIPSEKNGFDVWKDACADYNENELFILINDGAYVTMNRKFIVRIRHRRGRRSDRKSTFSKR